MKAEATAVAAEGPFGPADGNPDDKQGDKVGDHERAAAVLGRLTGKAQKVTESYRAAGHRQNYPEPRAPGFLNFRHEL